MADLGLETAIGKPINDTANRALLEAADVPAGLLLQAAKPGQPSLLKFDVRCIMLQLAYAESNNDHTLSNAGRLGKYQFTTALLKKYNYIDGSGNWLGKNGINSEVEFLSSSGLQDIIMQEFLQNTFNSLCLMNAIKPSDTKIVAGGMLAVAYQFQDAVDPARHALVWRNTGSIADSKARPGHIYYNYGRYAVQSLASSS